MRSMEGCPGIHKYLIFTEPGDTTLNNREGLYIDETHIAVDRKMKTRLFQR